MSHSEENSSWWRIALLFESLALAIALVIPFSPSKTRSDSELADYLLTDPTYLEKVVLYFVLLNGVLLCIWLAYLFHSRRASRKNAGMET